MQHTYSNGRDAEHPGHPEMDALGLDDGLEAFLEETALEPPASVPATTDPVAAPAAIDPPAPPSTAEPQERFDPIGAAPAPASRWIVSTSSEAYIAPSPSAEAAPAPLPAVAKDDAAAAPAAPTFTVEQVVSRRAIGAWAEAVAIVEELCTVLGRQRASAVPPLAAIKITREGTVEVAAAYTSDPPTAALGRLLNELLSNVSTVPGPLRVLVTAAGDAHTTIAEFAHALAYFGRPDRRPLIRTVFQRCLATPEPAPLPPLAEQANSSAANVRTGHRGSRWMAFALLGLLALMIMTVSLTVSWWLWQTPPPGFAAAAVPAVQQSVETATAREAAPTSQNGGRVAARPGGRSAQGSRRPSDVRASVQQGAQGIPRALPFPLAQLGGTPLVQPPAAPAPQRPEARPVVAPTEIVVVPSNDDVVYTSENTDVIPPVMTYPQLPPSALPEIVQIVNRLELLVGEDGGVRRVKMLSRPRRMADMMILSGIKMWRFRPASKGGRPVKYLTVMSWTVTP